MLIILFFYNWEALLGGRIDFFFNNLPPFHHHYVAPITTDLIDTTEVKYKTPVLQDPPTSKSVSDLCCVWVGSIWATQDLESTLTPENSAVTPLPTEKHNQLIPIFSHSFPTKF